MDNSGNAVEGRLFDLRATSIAKIASVIILVIDVVYSISFSILVPFYPPRTLSYSDRMSSYSYDRNWKSVICVGYIMAFVHLIFTLYLCISCWKRYRFTIALWLVVSGFLLMLKFGIEVYITNKHVNPLIAIWLLFINGSLICSWIIIFLCYKRIPFPTGQSQNTVAVHPMFYHLVVESTLCSPKINSLCTAVLLTVLCFIGIIPISTIQLANQADFPAIVLVNVFLITSAVGTIHLIVGICKKYPVFILIWLYYTAFLIIVSWVAILNLWYYSLGSVFFDFFGVLLVTGLLAGLCVYNWLIVFSYFIKTHGTAATSLPPRDYLIQE